MSIESTIDQLRSLAEHLDGDFILSSLGLQRRRVAMQALGLLGAFTAGAAVGAGVALALAPMSGKELREQIMQRIDDARDRMAGRAPHDAERENTPAQVHHS